MVMAGCGKKENTNKDKVTIELFSQKVEIKEFLDETIADFEKKNPNIEIKLTSLNDAATVLKTRMAGKDEPTIIATRPAYGEFREWAKDGRFVDLTDTDSAKRIKDGAAERFAVNEKIYTLPLTTNVSGVFYNKTEFEKLGLSVPKTLDEFNDLIKKIKADGQVPFSLALTTEESWALGGVAQIIWTSVAGSDENAQEVLIKTPKDGIKEDDPVVKEALKELSVLNKENAQKNANGASHTDSVAVFAEGKALMLPGGSYTLSAIKAQEPDFEIGMFAIPGKETGKEITMGAPDLSFSISSSATEAQQEAAMKFLEYFSSPAVMQKYFDYEGSPVFVKDIDTDGRHEEISEVASLVDTDKYYVWLQSQWPDGAKFGEVTMDYFNNQDADKYIKDLNTEFNVNK